MYHRTAHEACLHPEAYDTFDPSPPQGLHVAYVYIHANLRSRICMHASSCSICRIATGGDGKATCHSYTKRYNGTKATVTADGVWCMTVVVCTYSSMYARAQGALRSRRASCMHTSSRHRCSMRPYARPGQTPAQRAQPFREGR